MVAAFAVTSGAALARAQSFPVELEADRPGLAIRLFADDKPDAELFCGAHCTLNLAPGKYRLDLTEPDGTVASHRLTVHRPSHVSVAPPNQAARSTGKYMKETGALLSLVGLGTFIYLMFQRLSLQGCQGDCDEGSTWPWYVGGISLVGGMGLVLAGVAVEGLNSRAVLKVRPASPPSAPLRPSGAWLRVSPAAGSSWTGLALTGSF
jgi:hypothetical protein